MPDKRFAAKQKQFSKGEKKQILRRLWQYAKKCKGLFALAIALVLLSNAFSLLGPWLSGKAVDCIGEMKGCVNFEGLFFYAGLMVGFYILSAVFSYFLAVLMVRISQKITVAMRGDLFDRLLSLPVSFFDRNQTGDILSVFSYDVATVNETLSHDLVHLITSSITIVGSFVMMLTIAPPLVCVFLVTIPLSVFLTRFITKRTRPLFRRRSAKLGELNGYVEEMVGGGATIRAYGREGAVTNRFDEKNDEAVEAYTNAEHYGAITGPTVNFVNNLSLALVSALGALLYLGQIPFMGTIAIGTVTSFILYSRKFSGPINEIANMYGELQSSFSAAERVFRLMDEIPEKADAENAKRFLSVEGYVHMEDVDFGYTKEKRILSGFHLDAPKGSMIAIVGPTGAGKTTVINLLMRFYDINKGSVTLDGEDIYGICRRDVRGAYTMVLQDTWLFRGTVAENIAYGKEGATRDEIVSAARAAGIHRFIESLPEGYDTVLSEDGVNISKGQKQLLTIARAMLSDARMLILDEATSNVDTRTEKQIQSAMRKLMRDKTCFVIAHRLSTVENADMILVVKDGTVAERGTHEELLRSGGIYAGMYSSQFDS